jgi:hypothetical protein
MGNLASLGDAFPGQAAPRPGAGYLLASHPGHNGPGPFAPAAIGALASATAAKAFSQGREAQPILSRASLPLRASPAVLRAPFFPADSLLSGFSGCAPFTQGYGTVTGLRTQFLAPDLFAVFLSLNGEWGDYFHVDELDGDHKAFDTLFGGGYDFLVVNQSEPQGPVASTELSEQEGFLKVSVRFLENQAPASVSVETLCRGNELVLIHAFDYFSAPLGPTVDAF